MVKKRIKAVKEIRTYTHMANNGWMKSFTDKNKKLKAARRIATQRYKHQWHLDNIEEERRRSAERYQANRETAGETNS